MTSESYILLSNVSQESETFLYSDKSKGSGYTNRSDGFYTVIFQFDNFQGSLKLQGTLELYPSDSDWVDITFDQGSSFEAVDSTPLITNETRTFKGNFVWIRAAYQITQGTVQQIYYNY
jgi:hypothetical protein